MDKLLKTGIAWCFALVFFLIPLVLSPYTSEVFEFNKMVLTYTLSTVILTLWIARMIVCKKIIFQKTLLGIPLLLFLLSQALSSIFSIDFYTSIFGYYSRFNGGLISIVCYTALYFAFVSNIERKDLKLITLSLFFSTLITAIWAIFEHYGSSFSCFLFVREFNVNCWVQDIKFRVFSSFGQPNWLACWLAALIPVSWALSFDPERETGTLINRIANFRFILLQTLYLTFLLALIFTKSRSGLIGFGIGFIVFWGLVIILKLKMRLKTVLYQFVISIFIAMSAFFVFGTPWTPAISEIFSPKNSEQMANQTEVKSGTILETGGTESGDIRKIVYKGAIDVWKHYPIFGTGVETFAYSYYNFRPKEHNLVSEWDFLYNKAHNEYLNYLATTGILGLASYLLIILVSLIIFIKAALFNHIDIQPIKAEKIKSKNISIFDGHPSIYTPLISIGLLSGYFAILVSNFFGFSVVPTQLLLFLFPAISIVTVDRQINISKINNSDKLSSIQKISLFTLSLVSLYVIINIYSYWQADLYFNRGKSANLLKDYKYATIQLKTAISKAGFNALYYQELSNSYKKLALFSESQAETELASVYLKLAIENADKAKSLSFYDVNLRKYRINLFTELSQIDENYLSSAEEEIKETLPLAPTDAKLLFYDGNSQLNLGNADQAIEAFNKAIILKPNYSQARFSLARLYLAKGETKKAKEQLTYILTFINPNDSQARQKLDSLK